MAEPRLAQPSDNRALIDLFASVPMEGDLVLAVRREPDFFALYRLQRGEAACWIQDREAGSGLAGAGTVLVRDGWLDGRPQKVGYLCDLRAGAEARRSRTVVRHFAPLLARSLEAAGGATASLTAVLASNAAALAALTRRRAARASQPHYHLLRRFSAVSIQFRGRRRPYRPGAAAGLTVRTATAADLPALGNFLDEDHRRRPFGYRFDDGELEHRLGHWPGFGLDATYLVLDAAGRIAACATAWDPHPVRRYVVLAYRRSMRWVRLGWNAAARLAGWPRLPDPGDHFRSFYLCNVSVREEDPRAFRALLERVYDDHRRRGFHFFTVYADEDDPLRPALRAFATRELAFHLYAVTSANAPRTEFPPGRVGFEIALG
jgi:hypothetical protein